MNEKKLLGNKYWITKLTNEAMESIPNEISEDQSSKLSEVQSRIQDIQEEVYGKKEPTIKSVVQSLYDLSVATLNEQTMGEQISVIDLQEMFSMEIIFLAELLGIELVD